MSINPISALSQNLGTPQRSFLWQVIIPNVIGGGSDTNTLLLRCQSTSMPERSVGAIEIPYQQGPKLQIPGKLEYPHTWDCTFVEGEDAQVMSAFYNWAQMIVNDITNVGSPFPDVTTNVLLQMISTDGTTITNEYTLVNAWVQKIGQVTLDYNNQDVIRIPITFRYQTWEITGGNVANPD